MSALWDNNYYLWASVQVSLPGINHLLLCTATSVQAYNNLIKRHGAAAFIFIYFYHNHSFLLSMFP